MDIHSILTTYDAMFGKYALSDIEAYLYDNIEQAKEQSEIGVLFTLLNEMIGFCRDTTQKDKALKYCTELLQLLDAMKLKGSIEYATALLNIANAYRAFGLLEESLELFGRVEQIYKKKLDAKDFGYANLYNNWGLAYQEIEDYEKAKEVLLKALAVVDSYEEAIIPQATTRTNLATTLLQLGTEEDYKEAIEYLQHALCIHEENGGQDFHYGATLVALGDAYCFQKDFSKATKAYEAGLGEIEKHIGKNANYTRVLEKYNYAKSQYSQGNKCRSNMERSREFYETVGKEMIHTHFSEWENRIAVGLVGEGSDCYGFDDEISTDHDYAVGFCMWLTDADYEKIGSALQEEYDKLAENKNRLRYRRGVFRINDFYNQLLESAVDFEKEFSLDYQKVEEFQLAAATNGMVFRDDMGFFSDIRERLLTYYPEHIWRGKLAQGIHEFSQYAQSNYARMMARGDELTAKICVSKAIESTMDLIYLLNRIYAPYYKWKKKGMENFPLSKKILPLLEKLAQLPSQSQAWKDVVYCASQINVKDKCVDLFEQIAKELLEELKMQGLVSGEDVFLESYIKRILEGKNMDVIEKIVALEWKQFDRVKNEGGRADCQDDFETFSIMRKSQYLTWTEDLLQSFYQDLVDAEQKGWNLIMEKYARMMKSTNPEKYLALEKDLPVITEERNAIQEEIIKIQVAWMEEFAEEYPNMAGNARSIRTSEDTAFNTSYETYLRGEMSTYSESTFILYSGFIVALLKKSRNLAMETMENTAKLYGYDSLEDAERRNYTDSGRIILPNDF